MSKIHVKPDLACRECTAMPARKYIVRLSSEERQCLNKLVKTGRAVAYKRQRASRLIAGKNAWQVRLRDIRQAVGLTGKTILSLEKIHLFSFRHPCPVHSID